MNKMNKSAYNSNELRDVVSAEECELLVKKPYTSPAVKHLGSLSSVTLGGSPGTGDSGDAATQKLP